MLNRIIQFFKAIRCLNIKRSSVKKPAQRVDLSRCENQPTAPAEDFTGIYKGYAFTREDNDDAAYKQLDGECTFILNHDDTGKGSVSIYLGGEAIGIGLSAVLSSYNLTLNGVLWSNNFEWNGVLIYKNRVMALSGNGILKDTGAAIKLELVKVDEWKRPLNCDK